MAGKSNKDLELCTRSPKLNRHQLETNVSVLKDEVRRMHKELMQVRTDLKLERARALDLTYALQEKEQELDQQQKDYDQEMKDIISKLLLLEADFRKEKQEITSLIAAKDATIESLNSEVSSKNSLIESLRRKVESFQQTPEKDDRYNKLERKMEGQRHEIDTLRNANARLLDSLSHVRLGYSNTHHKGKLRRNTTPARGHGKSQLSNAELSEWTEELSAFF